MPEIFSPEINWITSLLEEREYETRIIASHNEVDQRISLMNVPHRRFTYSISALDEREAALLEALIRRVQGEPCYVPYWRGARYITGNSLIVSGRRISMLNASSAGFEMGSWLMLFVDAHIVGIAPVMDIQSSHIDIEGDIPGTWPIGRTKAVPVFLAQLGDSVPIDYAAKFAKTVQVSFDLILDQLEPSADCNWAFVEAALHPLFVKWEIDPTGGPTGGPALKGTLPAASKGIGIVDTGAFGYVTVLGAKVGGEYFMEAKVKTDWDIAAADPDDGVPIIGLSSVVASEPGTTTVPATTDAFEDWETLNTSVSTAGDDGVMSALLGISLGTIEAVPRVFWFAEMVIKDEDDNIVHSCLPNLVTAESGSTPIFAPLTALHRPGASLQNVKRAVDAISSPAGAFAVFPRADVPYTEHPLSLVFFNAEEVHAFQLFFDLVLGAFGAFWLPSYQQDLTPIGTIAADDDTFDIQHCGYTSLDFPGTQRRQIAFVQPDGSFIKRAITAAVDNGDGTETLTLNEPLGSSFTQNNANGICFLWYCRFLDDVEKMEWINADQATLEISVLEISDPPNGGSGDSADGFLSDIP